MSYTPCPSCLLRHDPMGRCPVVDEGAADAKRVGTERIERLRHALVAEGAPHDEDGKRLSTARYAGVAGWGHALCTCGATSEELPSAYQRRRWHRDHKDAVGAVTPRARPVRKVRANDKGIRSKRRGLMVHRSTLHPNAPKGVAGQTACGRWARDMTVTVRMGDVPESQRCKVCW